MPLARTYMLVCLLLVLILCACPLARSDDNKPDNVADIHRQITELLSEGKRLFGEKTEATIDSAVTVYDLALTIAQSHFGNDDTTVARAMLRLSYCYYWKQQLSAQDEYVLPAIEKFKRALGENHPEIGCALKVLADFVYTEGRFSEGERIYHRAIKILEDDAGDNRRFRHQLGQAYHGLADLYKNTGRFAEAEPYEFRIREIRIDLYGPNSLWAGKSDCALGDLYRRWGKRRKAEEHLLRGIAAVAEKLGEDHFLVAMNLGRLAYLYNAQDRMDEAEAMLDSAIALMENALGPDHLKMSSLLGLKSNILAGRGEMARSKELAGRALEINRNARGPYSPYVALEYRRMARLYGAMGAYDSCLAFYDSLLSASYQFCDVVFPHASESQKLVLSRKVRPMDYSLLALALDVPTVPVVSSAARMVLNGKARVLDALAIQREQAYCSLDPEMSAIAERHADICREIANLSLASHTQSSTIAGDELKRLYTSKDALEIDLSQRCAEFSESLESRTIRVSDVVDALKPKQVLWEFVRYRAFRFDKHGTKAKWGKRRYLAVVISPQRATRVIDLAPASMIDSLVTASINALREASGFVFSGREGTAETELRKITEQLYDLVVAPLVDADSDVRHVLISPDARLNLLPFDILPDPEGNYTIEKFHLSYLSTGRDLLKFKSAPYLQNDRAVVLSDPDFDSAADEEWDALPVFASVDDSYRLRGYPNASECLSDLFDPLNATAKEGEIIGQLLNSRAGLVVEHAVGQRASERLLKTQQTAPRVIHMATHGYFCSDESLQSGSVQFANPLLFSGLALAGANRLVAGEFDSQSQAEDGILTSLEASGMNLIGTELVVLSACQTGVGKVVNGEGVYGLRRAFQLAGARSIVMSMFAVPDQSTVTLMERFYDNWLSGQSKSSALRNASLSILHERREKYGAAHPLYWGGFVLVGNPN